MLNLPKFYREKRSNSSSQGHFPNFAQFLNATLIKNLLTNTKENEIRFSQKRNREKRARKTSDCCRKLSLGIESIFAQYINTRCERP